MAKYIDMLLVQDEEKSLHLVSAPSYKAEEGCIVRFMGGATGVVIKKAWMDPGGDVYSLISAVFPVFEAEAIYSPQWQKEETDAAS